MGGGGLRGLRSGGKPQEGRPRSGGGGLNRLQTTRPATERAGGSSCPRTTRPPTEEEGESSHGRMTQLHTQTDGESSCHGMNRPPERIGPQGSQNPGIPHSVPIPTGGGRTRAGGRGRKSTHRPTHQGPPTRWRRRRGMTRRDEATGGGGGDGDRGASRRHGAPKSTPHRRGCGHIGGSSSHRRAHVNRGGERLWRRAPNSINHRRRSGCIRGRHSQRGAGAGRRRHTEGGGGK